jgi:hypothetical protein
MLNHLDNVSVNQAVEKNSISAIIFNNFKKERAIGGKSSFQLLMNTTNYNTFTSPHNYFSPDEKSKFNPKLVLANAIKL